eukprot:2644514-Pleurochrysis_carterae.AAC.2
MRARVGASRLASRRRARSRAEGKGQAMDAEHASRLRSPLNAPTGPAPRRISDVTLARVNKPRRKWLIQPLTVGVGLAVGAPPPA